MQSKKDSIDLQDCKAKGIQTQKLTVTSQASVNSYPYSWTLQVLQHGAIIFFLAGESDFL